mmetsp:Transcript_34813/g.91138  ORF Transcript_34813/g.91138 Transcript_34813/m.91138 type:complete len:330 (+) Transcript_34813:67-1056(+)
MRTEVQLVAACCERHAAGGLLTLSTLTDSHGETRQVQIRTDKQVCRELCSFPAHAEDYPLMRVEAQHGIHEGCLLLRVEQRAGVESLVAIRPLGRGEVVKLKLVLELGANLLRVIQVALHVLGRPVPVSGRVGLEAMLLKREVVAQRSHQLVDRLIHHLGLTRYFLVLHHYVVTSLVRPLLLLDPGSPLGEPSLVLCCVLVGRLDDDAPCVALVSTSSRLAVVSGDATITGCPHHASDAAASVSLGALVPAVAVAPGNAWKSFVAISPRRPGLTRCALEPLGPAGALFASCAMTAQVALLQADAVVAFVAASSRCTFGPWHAIRGVDSG